MVQPRTVWLLEFLVLEDLRNPRIHLGEVLQSDTRRTGNIGGVHLS